LTGAPRGLHYSHIPSEGSSGRELRDRPPQNNRTRHCGYPLNLIRVMPAKGQDIFMATSIFLARLIGPVLLVVAAAVFMHRTAFRAIAEDFIRSPALLYLAGVLPLGGGLAIVLNHNVWVADWRILITLLGWLAALSGAARILLPAQVKGMGESMLKHPMGLHIAGAIWLVVGALLCFFGYFR